MCNILKMTARRVKQVKFWDSWSYNVLLYKVLLCMILFRSVLGNLMHFEIFLMVRFDFHTIGYSFLNFHSI